MTITPATLYWITRLDEINCLCTIVAIFSIFAFVIGVIMWIANLDYNDDYCEAGKKIAKATGIVSALALTIGLFVPTSKEMAMIYVVPHITESQVVKQDIPEVYDLGVKALKDLLKKETKEETKGE